MECEILRQLLPTNEVIYKRHRSRPTSQDPSHKKHPTPHQEFLHTPHPSVIPIHQYYTKIVITLTLNTYPTNSISH